MSHRPTWPWLCFILLLVLVPIINARILLATAQVADPIRCHIAGLPAADADKFSVFAINQDGQAFRADRLKQDEDYWRIQEFWVHVLALQLPERTLAQLERVDIAVGAEERSFSRDELRTYVTKPQTLLQKGLYAPGDVLLILPDMRDRTTAFPWVRRARPADGPQDIALAPWNWPGDAAYLHQIVQASLVPWALLTVLAFLFAQCTSVPGRTWCLQVFCGAGFQPATIPRPVENRPHIWNWIGFLFLVGVLAMLEVRQPYYFTQDDNLIESLPMILVGCRTMWQGEFPEYNPYLFLGSPLASLGMYALTYPPLPASYAIARHVLGHEYLTLEVFAVLHLAVGFFATRMLGTRLGMGALPANLVALSCVLSGPALIMGRCWFNFIPVLTWLPIMFLGLMHLATDVRSAGFSPQCGGLKPALQTVSWWWIGGMGLAAGLTFHVGFSQAAIYLNCFLCLAVLFLVVDGTSPWRRALAVVPALMLGAGIALPLIYQQWLVAADVDRFTIPPRGIAPGLPAMLLPYPVVEAPLPTPMGNLQVEHLTQLYFFGGVLAVLFMFQAVGWLFLKIHPATRQGTTAAGQVWTFCAVCALWLGLGDAGGLWTIIGWIPKIGFINRHPIRVMPFLVFFAAISGGLVLERLLRLTNARRRIELFLIVPALGLLVWHAACCDTAFYVYQFRPYPELPEEMRKAFWKDGEPTGRVASWTRQRSADPNFALLLPLDLPAVYRLPTWYGYNPLLIGNPAMVDIFQRMKTDPAGSLRAYGIRWNLSHDRQRPPEISTVFSTTWILEVTDKSKLLSKLPPEHLPVIYDRDGVVVSERSQVDALAFAVTDPAHCLPLEMHGWGIKIRLPALAQETQVVANFLHDRHMVAVVDGQVVSCRPDDWKRITVDVPAHAQVLEMKYRPPWGRGILLGMGTLVVGLWLAAWVRRVP